MQSSLLIFLSAALFLTGCAHRLPVTPATAFIAKSGVYSAQVKENVVKAQAAVEKVKAVNQVLTAQASKEETLPASVVRDAVAQSDKAIAEVAVELQMAKAALAENDKALSESRQAVQQLQEFAGSETGRANRAESQVFDEKKNTAKEKARGDAYEGYYHRLKFWLCFAAALLAMAYAESFLSSFQIIPMQYHWLGAAGAGIATFATLWAIL